MTLRLEPIASFSFTGERQDACWQYEVIGLPPGRLVLIQNLDLPRALWSILEVTDGVRGTPRGSYLTAEDALAEFQKILRIKWPRQTMDDDRSKRKGLTPQLGTILPTIIPASGFSMRSSDRNTSAYTHPVFLQCFMPTRHSAAESTAMANGLWPRQSSTPRRHPGKARGAEQIQELHHARRSEGAHRECLRE